MHPLNGYSRSKRKDDYQGKPAVDGWQTAFIENRSNTLLGVYGR
jgi:hypothetical protein